MKVVNIQFFALPKEIIEFLENTKDAYGLKLFYLIEEGNVFEAKCWDNSYIDEFKDENCTLVLSQTMIASEKLAQRRFEELNPNALYISIGSYNSTILKESWIFSLKIADDEAINAKWNNIGRGLKKITHTGGYSVFEPTNERKVSKNLRYTKGAEEAYKQKIKILPAFGKNIHFEIGK